MNAIIATRFSDQKQLGNTSTEVQLNVCRSYCKNNGLSVIGIHTVEAESAKSSNVARITELIEFCQRYQGKAKILVVFKIDRFARDVTQHYYLKTQLIKMGIGLRSATEPIDETPQGELMETILAGFAQFDNAVKRERVKLALERLLDQGIWPWRASTGYKNVKNNMGKAGIPVFDEKCARYIKEIFEKFASGQYTQVEISNLLKNRNITDYKNRKLSFSPQFINTVLVDKFYIGILSVPTWGREWLGKHQPLIDYSTFQRCQIRLDPNSGKGVSHLVVNPDFPLRGRLFCDKCGSKMTAAWCKGRQNKYPVYYCHNKDCSALEKSVDKNDFEKEFFEYLGKIRPNEYQIKRFNEVVLQRYNNRRQEFETESTRIRQSIDSLEVEKQKVIDLAKKGVLDEEDAKTELEKVKGKILSTKLSLNESHEEEFKIEMLLEYVSNFLRTPQLFWFDAEPSHKIRLQRILFPEGIIYSFPGFSNTKLSPIFELINAIAPSESDFVTPPGVEPGFTG